jgi:alpha-beta hydrolase superfamily lysophospholipase
MFEDNVYWQQIQSFLPEHNRIGDQVSPEEKTLPYKGGKIRYDEYEPKEASDISIVMFHGVGGNGRLLSFIAVPLTKAGFNVICPDLPGYGYTDIPASLDYDLWIEVATFMVDKELDRGRKVFVFGFSAGGMLAYNVACKVKRAAGLMVTNILDNRYQMVRDHSAKNKFHSRVGLTLLNLLPVSLQKRVKIGVKEVANMRTIVNDRRLMQILLKDKVASGSVVPIYFLTTMLKSKPVIEPAEFTVCPVLLAHPEDDRWTPVETSRLFFDKLTVPKRLTMLGNAGHFPIESPGLQQLEAECVNFISRGLS